MTENATHQNDALLKSLTRNHLRSLAGVFESMRKSCETANSTDCTIATASDNIRAAITHTAAAPSSDAFVSYSAGAPSDLQLKEYFQHLANAMDADERERAEQKLAANNNNCSASVQPATTATSSSSSRSHKSFDINWQRQTYCAYCKLAYWPHNCRVKLRPKCRVTQRSAKLYARCTQRGFRPGYRSYAARLMQQLTGKGMRLVYECARCRSTSTIVKQLRRPPIRPVALKTPTQSGVLAAAAATSLSNRRQINLPPPPRLAKEAGLSNDDWRQSPSTARNPTSAAAAADAATSKSKSFSMKKKFQSLQLRLKQNESQQAHLKAQKNNSASSLANFLQQLT